MLNTNVCLLDKNCIPCQGGVAPLLQEVASKLLLELGSNWIINESGQLYKEYIFNNFMEAMSFAKKVAKIAEKEAHHPDLTYFMGKVFYQDMDS